MLRRLGPCARKNSDEFVREELSLPRRVARVVFTAFGGIFLILILLPLILDQEMRAVFVGHDWGIAFSVNLRTPSASGLFWASDSYFWHGQSERPTYGDYSRVL